MLNQPWNSGRLTRRNGENHIDKYTTMNITSFIRELFGWGIVVDQPFLFEINENQPLSAPNLGNRFSTDDNINSWGNKEDGDFGSTGHFVSKEKASNASSAIPATYNLIILDESGSMRSVREDVVSGCNVLLQNISDVAHKVREIKQYMSIFCFDTSHSRFIFQNVPGEGIRDFTMADYYPNAYTPLYDAIGYTVTLLNIQLDNTKSVGMVTIITDGHENASHQWSHHMVVDIIEQMKKKGWVFTFIGAITDVETVATDLGINNFLKFEKTKEGMAAMFKEKKRSDLAYNAKRCYLERMRLTGSLTAEECMEVYRKMNSNYFVPEERITPDVIHKLGNDEIFVFGSNIQEQNDGSASPYTPKNFGSSNGPTEGIQGNCYVIPIVGNTYDELKKAIEHFNGFVATHPHKKFILANIGYETSEYSIEQIAPLFHLAYSFGNVYIPRIFLNYVN